jgi:hypothetical protein
MGQYAGWRLATQVMVFLVTTLLASCSKHAAPPTANEASAPASAPSSLAIAGSFLAGADQATIRAYLQSVKEIKPKKFSVKWSPDTLAVSRDEAARALREVSDDGTMYTFASSDPVAKKMKVGQILWIWGITLRRIDHVGEIEDDTIVHTVPVALTDALTDADIEFDTPVNFADAYGSRSARKPKLQKPTASNLWQSPFRPVLLRLANDEPNPSPDSTGSDASNTLTDDTEDLVAGTRGGTNGKIAGFEYSLGYKVNGVKINLELEARKEEEGSGGAENNEIARDQRSEFFEQVKEQDEARLEALHTYSQYQLLKQDIADAGTAGGAPSALALKQMDGLSQQTNELIRQYGVQQALPKILEKYKEEKHKEHMAEVKAKALASAGALAKQVFYIASDNLDVRFKSNVQLDGSGVASAIQIVSGKMQGASVHFADMHGRLDMEFIGRLGQPGNGAISIPVAHVPVMFNVPIPVYGIPFVYQLGGDFLVKLFLAGNHATQHFVGHVEFSGGAGFQSTPTSTTTQSNLAETEPEISNDEAMSPGTSGVVLAIQLPRVGLGLGLFGAGAMSFVDVVTVLTITNSAAIAALNPQCKTVTVDVTPHVGVEMSLMPLPIPLLQTVGSMALSQKVALTKVHKERVTPDIKMCHIG